MPHEASAAELFASAVSLETVGLDPAGRTVPALREVNTDAEANALGFHGSPTFTFNGDDLFPVSTGPGL